MKPFCSTPVNWSSPTNHLLLNPALPAVERESMETAWKNLVEPNLRAHIGIMTSGSSGQAKIALLSKHAMLVSARAVNRLLRTTPSDIWHLNLPLFHVGGLSVLARAHVGGFQVVQEESVTKWNPHGLVAAVEKSQATLLSLVPTQIFDIAKEKIICPTTLRGVVVGGGALDKELYRSVRRLGWPVLPTYGLTECCSQVATAIDPNWPEMRVLEHIQAQVSPEGRLRLKSSSLLTAYLCKIEETFLIVDPKEDGWLELDDVVEIRDRFLTVQGRGSDFVKIGGEGVNLKRLESILEKARMECNFSGDAAVLAVPDRRLGHVIHLLTNTSEVQSLCGRFDQSVLPFERIRQVHVKDHVPRSDLGKFLRSEALTLIGLESSTDV